MLTLNDYRRIGLSGLEAPDDIEDVEEFDIESELHTPEVLLDVLSRLTDDKDAQLEYKVLQAPDEAMRASMHQLLVSAFNSSDPLVRAMCMQEMLERISVVVHMDVEQRVKAQREAEDASDYLDALRDRA